MLRFLLATCLMLFTTALYGDNENISEINSYGSFFHTDRNPNTLFFFQQIKRNDSFELRKALRNHEIDSIVLASPGGSVFEGLQMAGIIFDKELATYVPINAKCVSACAFMFFAGKERAIDGELGVHQFYSVDGSSTEKVSETEEIAQFTVSEIIGFLNEFGTPPFVYERMFQQSDMYYFRKRELQKLVTVRQDIIKEKLPKIKQFLKSYELSIQKKNKLKQATVTQKPAPTETDKSKTNPLIEKTENPKDNVYVIKKIQAELNRLGCNAGVEDGIAGASTKRALKKLLEKYGYSKSPVVADKFYSTYESVKFLKKIPDGYCPKLSKLLPKVTEKNKSNHSIFGRWKGVACGIQCTAEFYRSGRFVFNYVNNDPKHPRYGRFSVEENVVYMRQPNTSTPDVSGKLEISSQGELKGFFPLCKVSLKRVNE